MLCKDEKKLLRVMFHRLLFSARQGICNISGLMIVDSYLSSLWLDDYKLTLKQYRKYNAFFNRVLENYTNDNKFSIISYRGV